MGVLGPGRTTMAKVAKEIIDVLNHNQTTHNGPIPNIAYAKRGRAALCLEFGALLNACLDKITRPLWLLPLSELVDYVASGSGPLIIIGESVSLAGVRWSSASVRLQSGDNFRPQG
jgi:hypothetical protein